MIDGPARDRLLAEVAFEALQHRLGHRRAIGTPNTPPENRLHVVRIEIGDRVYTAEAATLPEAIAALARRVPR